MLNRKLSSEFFILVFVTVEIKGELTIESVCLLMSIVPCKEIDLSCYSSKHIIEFTVETKCVSWICYELRQQ